MTESDAKNLIKSAERRRKTTRINLAGSLRAQAEALEIELADVRERERDQKQGPQRLTDVSPALELANRIRGLEEQMAEKWLTLVLEQQPWHKWRAFKANNPPRDTDEYDKVVGVNFDNLVEQFMPQCVVEPELDKEDWDGIFDKVAPGDLRDLGGVCYDLHETGSAVPKSRSASALIRQNEGGSGQPETGESVSDGTTGGSQPSITSISMSTESLVDPPQLSPYESPESPSGTSSSETEPKP